MELSIINFREMADERGKLVAIENKKEIPFEIKRVYYIYDNKENLSRGFHAHKSLEQVLICVHGSCYVLLDSGEEKSTYLLDDPSKGLYVGNMVWREMYGFSDDAVLLVLASKEHDESDYIRDYSEFLLIKRRNK